MIADLSIEDLIGLVSTQAFPMIVCYWLLVRNEKQEKLHDAQHQRIIIILTELTEKIKKISNEK